jgi:hypothetical protein
MLKNKFKISLFIHTKSLLPLLFLLNSCVSIPGFDEIPADTAGAGKSTIVLVTANEEGFKEKFGGWIFETTCVFPRWTKAAAITFNDQYAVYIKGDWLSINRDFFGLNYRFNSKARFSIPAGTYKVCLYKVSDIKNSQSRNLALIKNCCDFSPFQFEKDCVYEIYIYYSREDGDRNNPWRMAITDIRKK